jgi:thymidylate synthase (FAD)
MIKGYTINVLDHGFVRYVDHMGTDMDIVGAARVSYNSESKGEQKDKGLLEYLWKNKHTSPFEMCKLKIDVKLPIFIARQWIRHRMQNINEVSARYTELPGEFYIPTKWRKNLDKGKNKQQSEISEELDHEGLTKKVECFCEESYNQYKSLLKDGVAKEMARMVLPLNIYTQWISCWDLKNLLHFITLRDDAHAQAEIQEYSKAIKQILKELFPWTMEVYEKYKFVLQENKI